MSQYSSDVYDLSRIDSSPTKPSLMERLRRARPGEDGKRPWTAFMEGKSREEILNLRYCSEFALRPDQMLEAARGKHTFAVFAGRGTGKTTLLIYALMDLIRAGRRNILFVVRVNEDFEKTIIGDGFRKHMDPRYFDPSTDYTKNPQKVVFKAGRSCGGQVIPHDVEIRCKTSSLDDALRGFSPDTVIMDEIGAYRDPKAILDQVDFALREWGEIDDDVESDEEALAMMMADDLPKRIVVSTPVWDESLINLATSESTYCRNVPTKVNFQNLTPDFKKKLFEEHQGSRKAEQEIEGKFIDLSGEQQWQRKNFKAFRPRFREQDDADCPVIFKDLHFDEFQNLFDSIAVGVDPSGLLDAKDVGDAIGIHVAGRLRERDSAGRTQFVLIENATMRGSPREWMDRSVDLAEKWGASEIVYEAQGGQKMGVGLFGNATRLERMGCRVVPVTGLGKNHAGRAMMVSPLWEQGRVFHAYPSDKFNGPDTMRALEEEMLRMSVSEYNGIGSPDSTDAMVHAVIRLAGLHSKKRRIRVRMSKDAAIY